MPSRPTGPERLRQLAHMEEVRHEGELPVSLADALDRCERLHQGPGQRSRSCPWCRRLDADDKVNDLVAKGKLIRG